MDIKREEIQKKGNIEILVCHVQRVIERLLDFLNLQKNFLFPIITFIDTPGAYPGIGAEERGQSEAIARNLYVMSELKTPIIGIVIGEGGSGGALALGVVDSLLMLQYSTYSVISPEGMRFYSLEEGRCS